MEYTLFFSYQSDTKHEFAFIKETLSNEVKSTLAIKSIDLKIDFGMRNIAGNPDLLETMLEKGEKCDIFLADLTYVTNFINESKNKKHIPNPNVMLELGHAWNFHGNNHTIFIQNESHGKANDLPVDLKGFRFPISYELRDDASTEDRKMIRKNLSKDLAKAIEEVIYSIEENCKIKYHPLHQFALCQLHNSNEEFIITNYFNQLSIFIKEKLISNNYIIIEGKHKCGKSRIIKEYIYREYSTQEQNNILYCKFTQTNVSELCNKLNELVNRELKRETLFIIDNCNDLIITEIQSILCSHNHKCIFVIDSAKLSELEVIKIDHKLYSIDIIANKVHGLESEIIAKCGYNLEYIIRTLNNAQYTPYEYDVDDDSNILLSYLSLFSKVEFNNNSDIEFNFICRLSHFDTERGYSIIKQQINKGYVLYQGGFIFIESDLVANEYAKKLWMQKLAKELPFDTLINNGNLAHWFINRQTQVASQNKECACYLKNIIRKYIRDISFVDSRLGKNIIPNLAKLYPKELLNSMEILCAQNNDYKFQEIHGLLWALDTILRTKELFNRGIILLLSLRTNSTYNSVNVQEIASGHFKRISYDFNPNANIESFRELYTTGHFELIKDVYNSIFNVGYKVISPEQKQYLCEMFTFLISIRAENKDWANSIIINNVLAARHLGLSRQVFAEIRAIVEETETAFNVAELLSNKIRWASAEDKKSIKSLLKSISERNLRTMLYSEIVLFRNEGKPDIEALKSSMSKIATEVMQNEYWEDEIDILLRGGRKYDANCLWFGYSLSQKYEDCEKIITKCLDLYRKIPIEEQSYGVITGLFHKYKSENNTSVYKQKRNDLLGDPNFIHIAIALFNSCENTLDDLIKLKKSLITNSLSLDKLNDLYAIKLSEAEYLSFSMELIYYSKEGADVGIVFLEQAINNYQTINISNCIEEILVRYNYWNAVDYAYDSAYSKLLELLIYSLNNHPTEKLAETIIVSMINGCGSQHFNNNYSVVELFRILIKLYQKIFLKHISPIIDKTSLDQYKKQWNLEKLFKFNHIADNDVYFEWCKTSGIHAVEFCVNFIPLLDNSDNKNTVWTVEAKTFMQKYSDNSNILSIISTRLFCGEVSIAKYCKLKSAYESLISDNSKAIRLWAIEQAEDMDRNIQRLKDRKEIEQIWFK